MFPCSTQFKAPFIMSNHSVPLFILVGFLGAGKTSALKRAVQSCQKQNIRPWILLNDLENAQVDSQSFLEMTEDVTALDGSCICCEDPMALVNALADLPTQAQDVVFLEANGSTDAWNLLEWIVSIPKLRHFGPIQVVGVVDGERFQKRAWANALEEGQIKPATILWISKLDLLNFSEELLVKNRVRSVNSDALWLEPEEWLSTLNPTISENNSSIEEKLKQNPVESRENTHALSHKVSAQSWPTPTHWTPIDVEKWIQEFPSKVLRAKGLVRVGLEVHFFQWVRGGSEKVDWQVYPEGTGMDKIEPILIAMGALRMSQNLEDLKEKKVFQAKSN
jgi:G3E family GTPase